MMKILKGIIIGSVCLIVIALGIMLYAENANYTFDREKAVAYVTEHAEAKSRTCCASNALVRGILIHKGNLEFETFPLPCLPVSKGCFGVSTSMMEHIETIKKQSSKPILLYAYN